jgi:uncharacterized membrane protein
MTSWIIVSFRAAVKAVFHVLAWVVKELEMEALGFKIHDIISSISPRWSDCQVVTEKEELMALIQQIIHALLVVQPPHPLFVHFPVALISTALFFLLLAWWKKSDLLEKIAFANMSLAAVSTLVAGIVGYRDNLVNYGGNAPNHIAKIVIAGILFILTSTIAILRWRNPNLFHSRNKGLYLAAHVVCFVLVAVQGFLGGIIVYGF